MLFETFKEMISKGWVVPVEDGAATESRCWYLPFFVTKQEKSRVVFDGAVKFDGIALNDVVLPGINLLNRLVEVLIRFRVGRYACMADLSNSFLQVSVPESQREWCGSNTMTMSWCGSTTMTWMREKFRF